MTKRFRFLNDNYNKYTTNITTHFENKKFAIVINNKKLSKMQSECIQKIIELGDVDSIMHTHFSKIDYYNGTQYKNFIDYISKYKYIIIFEPDIIPGLVTKDIFSSFFAKSIPIYLGASDITRFISDETFIKYDTKNPNRTLGQIKIINANKRIYNNIVAFPKLLFDRHSYHLDHFLDPFISPKKMQYGSKDSKNKIINTYESGSL